MSTDHVELGLGCGRRLSQSVYDKRKLCGLAMATLMLLVLPNLLAQDPPTVEPTPKLGLNPEETGAPEVDPPTSLPNGETPLPSRSVENTASDSDDRPVNLFPKPSANAEPDASANPAPTKKPPDDIYSLTNPAVQIVTNLAQQGSSNVESLFTGLGGVPNPLSARYLSPGFDRRLGFVLDGARIYPTLQIGTVYRLQRGGGIPGGHYEDEYATISPAVTLLLGSEEAGHLLTLQYQGVISLGQTEGMGNYDQALQVNGTYNFTKLTLGVELQATELTGSDQDFSGDNASRLLLSLSGHLAYRYSEVTYVDFTLSSPIRLYQQGDSSEGLTSQTFLDYVYSPLTTVGIGFGLGTLVVEGRTQVFEQALLRLNYAYSTRLAFNALAGYEFRQADDVEEDTPTFHLGIIWQPRDETSFALSGEREIYNSAALAATNYTTTSISVTATQTIGDHLQASLSFGYNDNEYKQINSARNLGRDEQYFLVQGGLNVHLGARWTLALIASYSSLDSSEGKPDKATQGSKNAPSYGTTTGNLRVFQTSLQLGYAF